MVLTAKPASSRATTGVRPSTLASQYTSKIEPMAPTKASSAVVPKPAIEKAGNRNTPSEAPSTAPPDEPMTYGSARGLRKSP